MSTVAKSAGTDFPKAPPGLHRAVCFQVIDLGHQSIVWQGREKWVPKVLISWELTDELMDDGRPFAVSQRFTLSLAETSMLRPMLESWRGRNFTEEELKGFDVQKVLGAPCMLNVVHNTKDGKTYANVGAVTPVPRQIEKPKATNKLIGFSLDGGNISDLPEWVQGVIQKSREFQSSGGSFVQEYEDSENPAPRKIEDLNDDIPF